MENGQFLAVREWLAFGIKQGFVLPSHLIGRKIDERGAIFMVGYIYVAWSPALKDMVKIGYTSNLKQRLISLNSSTVVPKAFRYYASYEVEKVEADKILHHIIDMINPKCRVDEMFDGKNRVREFYYLTKEQAVRLLEAIAVISDTEDKLICYDENMYPIKKKRSLYEELIDYINSMVVKENSLFSECCLSILDFVNPVYLKPDNLKTINNVMDDIDINNLDEEPDEPKITNKKLRKNNENLFSLVFNHREVLETHKDYNFLKLLVPLSYDLTKFECFVLSVEWFINGFKNSLDKPLVCDCCSELTTQLIRFKNKVTKKEVFICDKCLTMSPNGYYASYFNFGTVCDGLVLSSFLDLRDKAKRYNKLDYTDIWEPFKFSMLIAFGLLPDSLADSYFIYKKNNPSPARKEINENQKVWLQNFCNEMLIPFLADDKLDDYEFDEVLAKGGFYNYLSLYNGQ